MSITNATIQPILARRRPRSPSRASTAVPADAGRNGLIPLPTESAGRLEPLFLSVHDAARVLGMTFRSLRDKAYSANVDSVWRPCSRDAWHMEQIRILSLVRACAIPEAVADAEWAMWKIREAERRGTMPPDAPEKRVTRNRERPANPRLDPAA